MRDSSFAHAQKESEQAKFPHGLQDCFNSVFLAENEGF